MRKSLKSALAAALCGATAFAAPPAEVLAGPMTATSPLSVGLTAPAEKVYYRRHYGPRRYYGGHYRRGYRILSPAYIGIMDMIRAAQSSRALRLAFWARESQVPRATATAIRAMSTAIRATAGAGEPARVFKHIGTSKSGNVPRATRKRRGHAGRSRCSVRLTASAAASYRWRASLNGRRPRAVSSPMRLRGRTGHRSVSPALGELERSGERARGPDVHNHHRAVVWRPPPCSGREGCRQRCVCVSSE